MFENLTIEPASVGIGLFIGLCIGALAVFGRVIALEKEKAAMQARIDSERAGLDEHFRALAQQVLNTNSESFLTLAQEKLKQAQAEGRHDLDKRSQAISEMVKPVEKHLSVLNGAVEQLQATDKTIREDLQNLSRETARLTGALKNPAAQGRWGEFVLERLLDKANLIKGVHYKSQVSVETDHGRLQPDVVIYLQDGFNIIVDAKAPITEFINVMDQPQSDADYKNSQQNLARAVRNHIKALGAKNYWEQLESPDFVVLFLPSENIFSAALMADPDLIDFASERQVVIASPTLMMSLLRVVGLSWRQVELAKNAQDISRLGSELFDRIATFAGHLDKVGGGINSALAAYNKAVGTFESRVLVSSRKLKDLHATTKDVETPRMLEGSSRPMTSLENSENEDEEAA